jgi:N4-gp56 family major capsid protein
MSYPSNNNTNINNELYANFVAQAQYAAYENSIARQLVTVFDVPMNAGKVVQVPVWSSITAQLITDEAAATAKTTNTAGPTITLAEHVVYNQVTDMLRDSAYGDVMAQLGDQSGRAIAESMDAQVFATFSDFSTNSLGTTSTELTVDLVLQAAATLRGQKLTGPFYGVFHPSQTYNIKKQLTYSSQTNVPALSDAGNGVLSAFYLGSIGGVSIFESALVTEVTAAGGKAYRGGVFSPKAISHAMRGGIDLNTLYLPAARATDMVIKATAGAAVIQEAYGVQLVTDARIN